MLLCRCHGQHYRHVYASHQVGSGERVTGYIGHWRHTIERADRHCLLRWLLLLLQRYAITYYTMRPLVIMVVSDAIQYVVVMAADMTRALRLVYGRCHALA